jgi:putative endonuclease
MTFPFFPRQPTPSVLPPKRPNRSQGQAAEDAALAYLQQAGLRLLSRNYRVPGRSGVEIDLVMEDTDGTWVFVEVRQRSSMQFGGAAASVTPRKQQRLIRAAWYYLQTHVPADQPGYGGPACRFDVVCLNAQPEVVTDWFKAAFEVVG